MANPLDRVPSGGIEEAKLLLKWGAYSEATQQYGELWERIDERTRKRCAADYARALRKAGEATKAIELLEGLFGGPPRPSFPRQEYFWCVYHVRVKAHPPDLRAAEEIAKWCSPRDKYSPLILTSLRVARYHAEEHGDFRSALEWLERLTPRYLPDDALLLKKRPPNSPEDQPIDVWHPSPRLQYYDLSARCHLGTQRPSDALEIILQALEHCEVERRSPHDDHPPVERLYALLIRASSETAKLQGQEVRTLLQHLLRVNGFGSGDLRDEYMELLVGGYPDYLGYTLDPERSFPGASLRYVGSAVHTLERERRRKAGAGLRERVRTRATTTASDLSDVAFCPASAAIKLTFETATTTEMKAGTTHHEKAGLNRSNRFGGVARYGSGTTALGYFKRLLPPPVFKRARPLLDDVAASKQIFLGHGQTRPQAYTNDALDFRGVPDYVYERSDGSRFVVEEKFGRYTLERASLREPYTSHHAQVASYINYLPEIGAETAYLVYWLLGGAPLERGDEKEPRGDFTVVSCSLFTFARSEADRQMLDELTEQLERLRRGARVALNPQLVFPRKCVRCSVTEYCIHKSKRFESVRTPYPLPLFVRPSAAASTFHG